MSDYDVLFVGAGHNALVCAGYLAQAGYKVGMVERRPVAGGAVVTEERVPGFRFDLGGSAHILIHHTPIIRDLKLDQYGLKYIDVDPLFFSPFPDGSHIFMWKDIDRTVESIAAVSPADAENYRKFIDNWSSMAEAMVETFLHAPTPLNVTRYLAFESKASQDFRSRLTAILGGYGQLLRNEFESPQVQGMIGWMAAQSGPPPTEPLSGPFALWQPMYHVSGVKRPQGGSGMLTQALARMIEAHGGEIHLGTPVARILSRNGEAVGVETVDGKRYTASKAVISGAHIHTTLNLLGDAVPAQRTRLAANARIGNGFGMIVRYAMKELPNYNVLPSSPDGAPGPQHRALQFICPDLDYLDRAYGDYLAGRPSEKPGLIAMSFSAVDPTLAPPGKHTLFLWGSTIPTNWPPANRGTTSANAGDHMLATLAEYAPTWPTPSLGSW
ncbi:MAG: NAD(P)/FAD-dependent oxidoreductase [Caldilineaceae bacterium]